MSHDVLKKRNKTKLKKPKKILLFEYPCDTRDTQYIFIYIINIIIFYYLSQRHKTM